MKKTITTTNPVVSSSPGRATVPPPFIKILRGKQGSRSRRSKSTPLFSTRRSDLHNHNNKQDPSSPKVSCIGQVRITKKNKKPTTDKKNGSCCCLNRVWKGKKRERETSPEQHRRRRGFWRWCCAWGYQKQSPPPPPPPPPEEDEAKEGEQGNSGGGTHAWGGGGGLGSEMTGFAPVEPPKNALLLMRCRSAPHRPFSEVNAKSEVVVGDGKEKEKEDEEMREVGPTPSFSSEPLILTRCKSEPATEKCFWKRSGSGKNMKWVALVDDTSPSRS